MLPNLPVPRYGIPVLDNLLAARALMAMSLGFHILFAVVGMAMPLPLLMVLAEARWLRRGDPVDRLLAVRWAKGTAILFAIGAVSGTALSFELGLLWPTFMRHAGPIIGMPFSLEGFAFFLEAIFLGITLYGWDRVGPRLHLAAGAMVALCGTASGVLVVAANAWMNTPQGFDVRLGGQLYAIHHPGDWPAGASLAQAEVVAVRVGEALFTPAFPTQALHTALASFAAVGVAVAGIHAWALLREPGNRFHIAALRTSLLVGGVFSLLMPLSGDLSARHLGAEQPLKLAAAEAHWHTEPWAPLLLGGWPDEQAERTRWALPLPGLLSVLAYGDPAAPVQGLSAWPASERPPVAPVHLAFQVMVGAGMAMAGLGALGLWMLWRGPPPWSRPWFLRACVAATPLGLIAVEAGWVVTEVGRQPWIARGMLRTAEAVTPMPHLAVPAVALTALYAGLGGVCLVLLRHHIAHSPREHEVDAAAAEVARA